MIFLVDPHCTDENADDVPILIPLDPLPDPAPPEFFGNPEQVSVYAIKPSKPTNYPADVCHVLSNQMHPSGC